MDNTSQLPEFTHYTFPPPLFHQVSLTRSHMISLTIHVRDFSPMKESRKTWVNLLARNGRWAPLRPSARIHSCKNGTINPYYKHAASSRVFMNTCIVHVSSRWYYLLLKKASMSYTLSLKSFLNNALCNSSTVPLTDKGTFSSFYTHIIKVKYMILLLVPPPQSTLVWPRACNSSPANLQFASDYLGSCISTSHRHVYSTEA